MTIQNKAPSITPYTKPDIRSGLVIPQESQVYRRSGMYELFRKKIGSVLYILMYRLKKSQPYDQPRITWDELTEPQNLPKTLGYIITGQRNTFATLKSANLFSLFQCKSVSTPLYVLENQIFESIPVFYQNKLQFVDKVTPKTVPTRRGWRWFIPLNALSNQTDEIESGFTQADFTAQELGIYNHTDWTDSTDKMILNQIKADVAEELEVARAVNFSDLAKQAVTSTIFTITKPIHKLFQYTLF